MLSSQKALIPPATRSAPPPISRARMSLLACVLLAMLGLGLPLGAQTDEVEDDKARRDDVRSEKAEAAAALDPLLTEDAELAAAVADLDANVVTQVAKLDAIRQALGAAREEAQEAAAQVKLVESELVTLRELVVDQAVYVYTEPDARDLGSFLTADDITEAAHKQALLENVTNSEVDVIDLLRAKQDEKERLSSEAAVALQRVQDQEAAEQEQLVELEQAKADQQRLRDALLVRIADVQAEIDALDAEEAALSASIRQAQLDEQARIEAERRAQEIATQNQNAATSTGTDLTDDDGSTPPVPTAPPLPPPSTASGLIWPTTGVVSSFYGPRWGRMHRGIDIAAPTGTQIVSVTSGTVITASSGGGYGNMVVVDHGGGFSTIYAHMTDTYVGVGDVVSQGTAVGTVGCTGSCTGPHLHFETRVNGIAQDPMLYLG